MSQNSNFFYKDYIGRVADLAVKYGDPYDDSHRIKAITLQQLSRILDIPTDLIWMYKMSEKIRKGNRKIEIETSILRIFSITTSQFLTLKYTGGKRFDLTSLYQSNKLIDIIYKLDSAKKALITYGQINENRIEITQEPIREWIMLLFTMIRNFSKVSNYSSAWIPPYWGLTLDYQKALPLKTYSILAKLGDYIGNDYMCNKIGAKKLIGNEEGIANAKIRVVGIMFDNKPSYYNKTLENVCVFYNRTKGDSIKKGDLFLALGIQSLIDNRTLLIPIGEIRKSIPPIYLSLISASLLMINVMHRYTMHDNVAMCQYRLNEIKKRIKKILDCFKVDYNNINLKEQLADVLGKLAENNILERVPVRDSNGQDSFKIAPPAKPLVTALGKLPLIYQRQNLFQERHKTPTRMCSFPGVLDELPKQLESGYMFFI